MAVERSRKTSWKTRPVIDYETGGAAHHIAMTPKAKEGALGNRGRLTDRTYCTARRLC